MTNNRKPSLAIISSYNDVACANATYTRLLTKVLKKFFQVTVFFR